MPHISEDIEVQYKDGIYSDGKQCLAHRSYTRMEGMQCPVDRYMDKMGEELGLQHRLVQVEKPQDRGSQGAYVLEEERAEADQARLCCSWPFSHL